VVILIAMRESGWLPPKLESFMWRQLAAAYAAQYKLVGGKGMALGLKHLGEALDETPENSRVYLDPWTGGDLETFAHPEKASYIFGRAGDDCRRWRKPEDCVVRINTPNRVDMFAVQAAAIVLHDRQRKNGDR